MPTMWLSDNQKIGVIFCSGGALFLFGGVLLFFDRSLLAMGNILFLIGLTLIIGVQKTLAFFSRRQKLKGTAAFTAGILLILLRWPLTGFLIELYGLFILFGDFLITIGQFAGNIPVVGPYLQKGNIGIDIVFDIVIHIIIAININIIPILAFVKGSDISHLDLELTTARKHRFNEQLCTKA
ncbi:Vesicle transport protein, Got1/SFT2-like [Aspergillus oryzae]|uniref:Vesicle transport protein, Got1/SFT2-like n=1 Tax=Aspergillus oryzae TaxID=5062 RepID=A0A1S9DPP7_ASPOZ|nr:Vesicle transport protein, Got1/SFT2-like [Aspergillus oryzae]